MMHMTTSSLLKNIIKVNGVKYKNIENVTIKGQTAFLAKVEIKKSLSRRCPICNHKCKGYDTITENRKWRSLDLGGNLFFLQCNVHRVQCPIHGVHVEAIPWASHNSHFTYAFEEMVTWSAVHLTKKDTAALWRINWRTVGDIVSRTKTRLEPDIKTRWKNLKRIGIDETSYKKGHKYLTVVVDHDTNQVVFVAPGHDYETLSTFFKQLTEGQRQAIEVVSCDGAKWIKKAVKEYLPKAEICIDPFHVVTWAEDAMDEERKSLLSEERKAKKEATRKTKGRPKKGETTYDSSNYKRLQDSKFALGKNPENLTIHQQSVVKEIQEMYPKLFKAYGLKEGLRAVFKASEEQIEEELNKWLWWASHSRKESFVKLAKKIRERKEQILATVKYRISNARIESTNNKIKVIIRKSYGFRNIQNLTDMILLTCSNLPVCLPYNR